MKQQIPRLVDSQEVARLIGCRRSTLTRWVTQGKATAARKGPGRTGAYLFTEEETARLVDVYGARYQEAS